MEDSYSTDPFRFIFVVAALVTVGSCFLRTYGYGSYNTAQGINALPDTGFYLLPDWSDYTFVDDIFVATVSLLFLGWTTCHSARRVIWRRTLLLWTVVLVVTEICYVSTQLPDPRKEEPGLGRLRFSMHPQIYSLTALSVSRYTMSLLLSVGTWIITTLASLVAIACREYYTVDVLSSYFITILTFTLYMWYVRGPHSIQKRPLLMWFEADFIQYEILSPNNTEDEGDSESVLSPTRGEDAMQSLTQEYVSAVKRFTLAERNRHRLLALSAATALCGAAVTLMFVLNHVADIERPIRKRLHDPLMEFLAPLHLPQYSADVLLYALLGAVLVAALCHPMRCAILRRNALTYAIIILLRCLTVPATFPPDPSPMCQSRNHPVNTGCGDIIFSGHTVTFLLCAFAVHRYWRRPWLTSLVMTYTAAGLLAIIGSRFHYTRDVLIGFVICCLVYTIQYTMYMDRPDRVVRYRALEWFERDYYFALLEEAEESAATCDRDEEHAPLRRQQRGHDYTSIQES